MQADLNLIVKGAALMALGVIASKILGYFFNIFLARILTPSELGLFFIATAVIGLFGIIANIGIADSLTRFVAFYKEKKDLERVKGSILSTIRIHIVSSIAIGITVFFLSDWIAIAFFSKPELGFLLKLLAFVVPVSLIASDLMLAMDGFKKIQYKIYIRRIIQIIAKIILLAGFFYAGLTLTGAVLTFIFSEAIGLVFAFFFLEKKVFSLNSKIKTIFVSKEMLVFSMPLFLMGLFSAVLAICDVLLLGFFAPAYNTGIYSVALDTARLGLTPVEIMAVLGIPIATSYFALEKFAEFKKIYNALARWTLAMVLPLSLLLVLFAEPVQILFFGKAYANSALAMSILLTGFLFYAVTGPAQQTLIAAGKTKLTLFNAIIAGVTVAVLDIILIPLFMQSNSAQIGAAIGTAIAYIAWGALGIIELHWLFRIQPFTKTYFKIVLAGISGTAIAFLLATLPITQAGINAFMAASAKLFGAGIPIIGKLISGITGTGIMPALVTGLVFLPIYALFFLALKCFEKEDLEVLVAIERKTGFRIEFLRKIVKKLFL
jgi:O-antigen/teichoic acid export membrane protein